MKRTEIAWHIAYLLHIKILFLGLLFHLICNFLLDWCLALAHEFVLLSNLLENQLFVVED